MEYFYMKECLQMTVIQTVIQLPKSEQNKSATSGNNQQYLLSMIKFQLSREN